MAAPLDIYCDLTAEQQKEVREKLQIKHRRLHLELDFLCPIVFDDYSISDHSKQTLINILA